MLPVTCRDELGRAADSRNSLKFPPLRPSKPETADRGTMRLGDSCISAEFPSLRQSKPETADGGMVRLGDANIMVEFAPRR